MRVHHLAFRTPDLERLERFYAGVLGLDVLRRTPGRSVWLDLAGTILMLEQQEPIEPAVHPATKELVCFSIDAHDGRAFAERLEAAGTPIEERTAFTLYFRDPDGRRLGASAYPVALG